MVRLNSHGSTATQQLTRPETIGKSRLRTLWIQLPMISVVQNETKYRHLQPLKHQIPPLQRTIYDLHTLPWTYLHKTWIHTSSMLPLATLKLAVNCHAFLKSWSFGWAQKWIDFNPQKRENRRQQDRPQYNDGRRAVLATHETFEEGIQMENHPY